MRKSILLSVILMAIAPLYPLDASEAERLTSTQSITVQFDNGVPLVTDETQPLQNFGDTFQLGPNESFSIGVGTSSFTFKDFPPAVSKVQLALELHPGDRTLNLSLPGDIHITTEKPKTTQVWVPTGAAMSIAYGHNQAGAAPVTVTYLDAQ